jgi:hypothetical protein
VKPNQTTRAQVSTSSAKMMADASDVMNFMGGSSVVVLPR